VLVFEQEGCNLEDPIEYLLSGVHHPSIIPVLPINHVATRKSCSTTGPLANHLTANHQLCHCTDDGTHRCAQDLRLQAGKPTLGWFNPLLYAHPEMFNDITVGSNGAGIHCGGKGFPTAVGWDPVTGLGTPNYPAMAKVVNALP
jgi:hypothetical protein